MRSVLREICVYILAYVVILPVFVGVAVVNLILRVGVALSCMGTKVQLAPHTDSLYQIFNCPSIILVVFMCDSNPDLDLAGERDNFGKYVLKKRGVTGP